MDDPGLRALRMRTACAVDHTKSLALRDPARGSEVRPLADGWLVLAGAGMYLNQAIAAGIEDELTAADLDVVVTRSDVARVKPAFEVTPSTLHQNVRRIRAQGFVQDPISDIIVLTRPVMATPINAPNDVVIRPIESEADLRLWQDISANGWGHTRIDARQASDAFAAAAHALDNEFMAVAFDMLDGRPVGCASMTVRDGVAMMGGMSTVLAERRRGVQAALLRYRVDKARGMGCELAITTAAKDGSSQRNLKRHGFTPRFTIQRFTLAERGRASTHPRLSQ